MSWPPLWALGNAMSWLSLPSNLDLLFPGWVTLGKFLNFSVPQFPQSGNKNNSQRVAEDSMSFCGLGLARAGLWETWRWFSDYSVCLTCNEGAADLLTPTPTWVSRGSGRGNDQPRPQGQLADD